MSGRPLFYATTAIPYANGAPHIGHAYERDRDRRDRAVQAARRLRRLVPHRHGRARPEDAADGGAGRADAASTRSTARRRSSRRWARRSNALARRHHPHDAGAPPCGRRRRSGGAWRRNGDIYLSKYAGWYSVRDEAYYDEDETRPSDAGPAPRARPARRSNGSRRRAISSGSRPIRTGCLKHLSRASGFRAAGEIPQRDRRLRRAAACRISRSPARPSTGAFRCPGDRKHVMYVWVDALTNYITGDRLSRTPDAHARKFWPADAARHRQGHHALPRGLLAGLPDVGRDRAAEADRRRTAFCSTAARKCRSRSATSSIRSRSPDHTASIRCAISSCARCRSGRTAIIATRRSSTASTPISPTISAIWRSARCR